MPIHCIGTYNSNALTRRYAYLLSCTTCYIPVSDDYHFRDDSRLLYQFTLDFTRQRSLSDIFDFVPRNNSDRLSRFQRSISYTDKEAITFHTPIGEFDTTATTTTITTSTSTTAITTTTTNNNDSNDNAITES